MEFISVTILGMKIINTTKNHINFLTESGAVLSSPPSGVVLKARKVQTSSVKKFGAQIMKTAFVPEPASEKLLAHIEAEHSDALILGTPLTAQLFPGRVVVAVPYPGFEKVIDVKRKMTLDKFMAF